MFCFRSNLYLPFLVGLALAGMTAHAQELAPGDPEPAFAEPTPFEELQLPDPPATDPAGPPAEPNWTYQHSRANAAGTVTNTHRGVIDEEAGHRLREHEVMNPRGKMLQTRERTRTEEGYLRRNATVWTDPDFAPDQRAFYYARVIEIPTPRWIVYDAFRYGTGIPEGAATTHQERAYTSPIWYAPQS